MLSVFSPVQFFVNLWTVAHQAPLFMGFSRQGYWNGLPCPPPGDFPNSGIKPASLASPALEADSTREAPKTIQIAYKSDFQIRSLSKGLSHWLFNICGNHYGLPFPSPMHKSEKWKWFQLCPILCNPIDYSSSGSFVHGILQARILEWISISSFRGYSWSKDWTSLSYISCIGRQVLYH